MRKSESMLAFEAALKENKELLEKFVEIRKRIIKNKEAANDGEVLVKAAAELGYTLKMEEVERALAEEQDLSEEELTAVSGGTDGALCWKDYSCITAYRHDRDDGFCFYDYSCFAVLMYD